MLFDIPDFVTGCTHFLHRNIVKYSQRPDNHDEIMVERWRETVSDSDIILHLGDLSFGLPENFEKHIAPHLTGIKYLIKGNHDRWPNKLYESWGFKVIKPFVTTYEDHVVEFNHYPKPVAQLHQDSLCVHAHTHNNSYESTIRHLNVGVDLFWGGPVDTHRIIQSALYRIRNEV